MRIWDRREGKGISRRICVLAIIGTLGSFLLGCNVSTVRGTGSVVSSYGDPGVIALIPFFTSHPDTEGRGLVPCPRCEGYIGVGEIGPEGPQVITSFFRRKLVSNGYSLPSERTVSETLPPLRGLEEKPEVLSQRLAFRLQVESVLMGWVFRYRERIGGTWGVQKPASVAFVALLFNGQDGRLLWRGRFDETQQPLFEDVRHFSAFVRRGGRWLTAEQLATDGISQVLLTFPGWDTVRINQ